MKEAGAAFKVGLFIVLVAVSIWYSLHAITEGIGGTRGYTVYALFRDATGLVDKSMVQIAGLRVGQITHRRLQDRMARVDIFLDKKVVLYENAAVVKKVASLMGGYYLEIDPGTPESMDPETHQPRKNRQLSDGDQIRLVEEPVTTGDIMNRAGDLIPEVQNLVQEIRKLAATGIPQLVRNTDEAIVTNSRALNQLLTKLDSIVDDVKVISGGAPRDVNSILSNVRELTKELRNIVQMTGGRIHNLGGSAQNSLDRINALIDKLDKKLTGETSILGNTQEITSNLNEITQKMKDGEGTIGRFITSATIAENIEQITGDAKRFLGGITRLDTVVGLRTEYNLIANSVKTYISVSIYPREDKYYLIELIDDPRGLRSTRYTVTRTDNPEVGPPLSRTEELSVSDSFRLSFMFAKKVDNYMTFRFGIKESTGGGGMDLHLFDNRFTVHADLFDFSSNTFPRLKIGMIWEFYRRIFFVAGADDIMNERPRTGAGGGRDFYIGAQIRFSDEDLKALLMFGGSAIGGLSGGSK